MYIYTYIYNIYIILFIHIYIYMCFFFYVHMILYDVLTVHWSHAEKKGGKGPMNCKDE